MLGEMPLPKGAVGRVCNRCNTEEMNIHLRDISNDVSPGCHGIVVLNGASLSSCEGVCRSPNPTPVRAGQQSPTQSENAVGKLTEVQLPPQTGACNDGGCAGGADVGTADICPQPKPN